MSRSRLLKLLLSSIADQNATAADGRLRSQQVLPDKVDQRGGGDLKAVRVGSIGQRGEGLSWFQGQDLRQRDLLPGQQQNLQALAVVSRT